jgi:uncharacterized membrane protein
MMLQGHFIDTMLRIDFRDTSYVAYNIWSYFRGITAPIFFTISGLVFLYLLLKANEKGNDRIRLKKGITRGAMLIGIGYLLRISLKDWFSGYFNPYILVIDVLQIIGLSLIILIGLYLITRKNSAVLGISLFIIGFICFVTEPLYRTITLEHVPLVIANYMTKTNGSIFTILPWFGYMAYGGLIAIVFFRYQKRSYFRPAVLMGFYVIGFLLIYYSSLALHKLHYLFDFELFERSANYNYLFTRLGNVLILFAVFYTFENYLKQSIITKIGEKTLSIYVVHFIIIYGSFTGLGLNRFFYRSLDPWVAITGAIIFMICVCLIVFYGGRTNAFVYNQLRRLLHLVKNKSGYGDPIDDED